MQQLAVLETPCKPLVLCLLCGLPASGKTTLARSMCEALTSNKGWQCARISYDDIITQNVLRSTSPRSVLEEASAQVTKETSEHLKLVEPLSNWKQDRRELLLYVDHFLTSVAACAPLSAPGVHSEVLWASFVRCLEQQNLLSSRVVGAETPYSLQPTADSIPFCVVMDDNFYYQSMRYEVFQLARKHSAGFCQLFLDCPVEACLQRNRQRLDPLPDEIIRLMSSKMERPNPDKNPWEQKSLTLDMSSGTLDNPRVTEILHLALVNPVTQVLENTEQKESDRAISASNFLHQVDQALRRIVSQTMQRAKGNVPMNERKILAQELLHLKGDFLEKLRQGSGKESHSSQYMDVAITDAVTAFQDRADYIFVQHITFFKENTET